MAENHLYFIKGTSTRVGTMGVLPEVRLTEGSRSISCAFPTAKAQGN